MRKLHFYSTGQQELNHELLDYNLWKHTVNNFIFILQIIQIRNDMKLQTRDWIRMNVIDSKKIRIQNQNSSKIGGDLEMKTVEEISDRNVKGHVKK